MKYSVEFDDVRSEDLYVYATQRPDIPAPVYDLTEITIPGRDGALHIDNKRYEPITISITFTYVGPADSWAEIWRKCKKWMAARNTTLRFSDDNGYFYHAYNVKLDSNSRKAHRVGEFKADFVCAPYMYLDNGTEIQEQGKTPLCILTTNGKYLLTDEGKAIRTTYWQTLINNDYEICHPVYEITGDGNCEMFINGYEIKMYVAGTLIIDTENEVAYRGDGEKVSQTISGRYPDMWLQPGRNKIVVQDKFDLSITPNWREL
ncbi:hypothetical protein [Muricomes intestini]|uniref:hypothetical protein n=1 Tax=Muricomes intestini TaxID=1796634 RepID=UPI002FE3EBD9